jgi:hypothetical protein
MSFVRTGPVRDHHGFDPPRSEATTNRAVADAGMGSDAKSAQDGVSW